MTDNTPTPTNDTPDFTPPMTQEAYFASLEDFDAITDIPTWQGLETLDNRGPAPALTLAAFGPDDQQALNERADQINPSNREVGVAQAIAEKLDRSAINLRVRSTSGDATHFVQELCAIEYETVEAEKQSVKLLQQLDAKRMVIDPVTGAKIESSDHVITGSQRDLMMQEVMALFNRSTAMAGKEGTRRLQEAKEQDWATYVGLQRRLWEAKEVDRRAHKMASDDRINAAAATRARHLKGSGT